jgi:hypothetical protein
MKAIKTLSIFISVAVLLSACNGGGTGSTTSSTYSVSSKWSTVGLAIPATQSLSGLLYDKSVDEFFMTQSDDSGKVVGICHLPRNASESQNWNCDIMLPNEYLIYANKSLMGNNSGQLYLYAYKKDVGVGSPTILTYDIKSGNSDWSAQAVTQANPITPLDHWLFPSSSVYWNGLLMGISSLPNVLDMINLDNGALEELSNFYVPAADNRQAVIGDNLYYSNQKYSKAGDAQEYIYTKSLISQESATQIGMQLPEWTINSLSGSSQQIYVCTGGNIYANSLPASTNSQWRVLPPTSQLSVKYSNADSTILGSTGCYVVIEANNTLYALAQVYESESSGTNYERTERLLKLTL